MDTKSILIGILVLLTAAAGLYFILQSDSPQPAPTVAEPAPRAPDVAPPVESGPPPAPTMEEVRAEAATAESDTPVTFRGSVQHAQTQAPIAGAEVFIEGDDENATSVRTDEEGNFLLQVEEAAASEAESIVSRAGGFALNRKTIASLGEVSPGAELYVSFLLHPGIAISGTVSDSDTGEPIAHVDVRLIDATSSFVEAAQRQESRRPASTNDEGAYILENLSAGAYRVVVDGRQQGYVFDSDSVAVINAEAQRSYDAVDFQLQKAGEVRGRVLNAQGVPVARAQAALVPAQMIEEIFQDPEMLRMMGQGEDTTSDNDGRFLMVGVTYDLDYRVMVEAENYAPARSEVFQLTRAAPSNDLEFVLTAGSTVSGTAVYEDGSPAADHNILMLPNLNDIFAGAFSDDSSATTDASGAFTFEHVAAGAYNLISNNFMAALEEGVGAFNPLEMFEDQVPVEVDGINAVTGVQIVVKRATVGSGAIQGVVLTKAGQAVGDVRVNAKPPGGLVGNRVTDTAEDGTFTFKELKGETYDIQIRDDRGSANLKNVAVGSNIVIHLDPPIRVTGRVVDEQGLAVADGRVQFEPIAALEDESFNMNNFIMSMMGAGRKTVETDDNGYFEFSNLDAGGYVFKAKSPSKGTGVTNPVYLAAGQSVDNLFIKLDLGVTVTGTVVDKSGSGVDGATVSLVSSGTGGPNDTIARFLPDSMKEKAGTAMTDNSGAFRMANVPAGSYVVSATHKNYAATRMPGFTITPRQDVRNLSIVITGGGCVTGIARIGGEVKAGNMVQLIGEGGTHMATTDAEGHFELCSITPGTYLAQAVDIAKATSGDLAGATGRPIVVDIEDGESLELSFDPPVDGVPVYGVVTGDLGGMTTVSLRTEGGPLPEEIDIFDPLAQVEFMRYVAGQAIAGPDGAFDMGGVAPGEYILEVMSMDMDMSNLGDMMNADRTPQIRRDFQIREGSEPIELNLVVPPRN